MKQFKLIKFNEYMALDDDSKAEYNYAANYSNSFQPTDIFNFGEITKLPFGTVKDMQYMFNNTIYWMELLNFVSEQKDMTLKQLGNIGFFELVKFKKWVRSGLDYIDTLENTLRYESTPDDENAGIDTLAKYGVSIQIDKLALGQVWMWDTVREQPYDMCFLKLAMDKDINDYTQAKMKQVK